MKLFSQTNPKNYFENDNTQCINYDTVLKNFVSFFSYNKKTFEATMLGQVKEMVQERIGDDELILTKKY